MKKMTRGLKHVNRKRHDHALTVDDSDSDDAEDYDTSAYAKWARVANVVEEHGPDDRRLRKY